MNGPNERITKKKTGRRKPHSTASSSLGGTEVSIPQTDILELGEHIVRELGVAGQRDTLSRWLSHHIASLLKEREEDDVPLSNEVISLILRLWEHRRALPGRTWPIAELAPLLEVMGCLRPDSSPWGRAHDPASARLEMIHDGFV